MSTMNQTTKWIFVLAFMSTAAMAEVEAEALEAQANHFNTTVCSAVASDGKWQLYHSDFGINYTCQVALQGLRQRTFAPITNYSRMNMNRWGMNTVRLHCWGYSNIFIGQGLEPLYRAYNLAWTSQLAYCTFSH
jgi:hypothetical protein